MALTPNEDKTKLVSHFGRRGHYVKRKEERKEEKKKKKRKGMETMDL